MEQIAIPDSERAIFTDLYHYYCKYQPRQFDMDTFCEAADEAAEMVERHGQHFLAKRLFGAAYEAFGDRYKEEQDQHAL